MSATGRPDFVMALAAGDRLGPYEIVSALGVGGMGEVYRAHDRTLHRDVAIKVLPDSLATDPDRVARFERESRVLASLNHPNIAHIYGVEETTTVRALVLELVEGITLADRIARGALGIDEALPIAMQIAEALGAAHELGVVHRDLKPANVKMRPDGTVKVLDFGLAKALESVSPTNADITASPTVMTPSMTGLGVILGTAAYMSPEQARGEIVDKRCDIWAFGAVVFEMLTGRPLFARQTVADTIAAVLHIEPDWSRIPVKTQPALRACLQKDPKRRLRDIGDVRLLLDHGETAATTVRGARRNWTAWTVAALATIAAAALAWAPWRALPLPPQPIRFQIAAPGDLPPSAASAISPDGRYLAFLSSGSDRVMRVWVRDLSSSEDRPLQGTEIGQAAPPPFWSPDSRFIAYDAGGTLKKIEVSGGLAQTICELRQPAVGGSWNREGVILFGSVNGGIMRVPDSGGVPAPATALDPSRNERAHLTPVFLPDGRHFLYLRVSRVNPEQAGIFVGSLDVRPEEQSAQRVVATTTSPIYARAADGRPGRLLFLRDGNLMAQAFDERRLELFDAPILVSERVHSYLDTATVSASDNDVLVFKSATQNSQLAWVDRQGRAVGRPSEPGLFGGISLSPDATRLAVVRVNPQVTSSATLWLLDVPGPASSRFASASAEGPVWSPDGSRIVFASGGSGFENVLLRKPTGGNGQEEQLLRSDDRLSPTSWSGDGRFVLYVVVDSKTNSDLWVLALDGGSPKPLPFLRSEAAESQGQFSPTPGGPPRWVAFTSNESGRDDVELRTFPDAQNRMVVSSGGGHSPRWRKDGRELFYLASDGMVMSVAISDNPVRIGTAIPLFRAPQGFSTLNATGRRGPAPWDVTPDGQRFLFVAPVEAAGASEFIVVLNWQNGLAK